MINLAHLSDEFPIDISEKDFEKMIAMKTIGWTQCDSEMEWLSKLYYLRKGVKEGKISKEDFHQKEKALVINWWEKWC
ncbi:MAG: hypothetical protein OEY59_06010 [Deltaproteobacteria bacterium]|nr:hypothetical protein [Deltaproteobacteria bacterium]